MRSPVALALSFLAIFLLSALYFKPPTDLLSSSSFSTTASGYLPSRANIKIVRPKEPGKWPYRVFETTTVNPPHLSITRHDGDEGGAGKLAEGYIFLAPRNRKAGTLKEATPYILTSDNEPVYVAEAYKGGYGKTDFRMQMFRGKPHLTFWRGVMTRGDTPGHGYGQVVFLDEEYTEFVVTSEDRKIVTLRDKKQLGLADMHEHEMTDHGTMLVTAYNNTPYKLVPVKHARNEWVVDSMFYEIDVPTGKVLFSWSALEHVDVRLSHLPRVSYLGDGGREAPYDFFHITSVQAVGPDHFLVNSRHMWSTYLVSRSDGSVVWELNGVTGGDFGPVPDAGTFRWTHHARAHDVSEDSMTISWLDNHNIEEGDKIVPTRGLVLQLSLPPDTSVSPKLVHHTDYKMVDRFHSKGQGSYQIGLQHGNQFMCYGETPVMVEFDSKGNVIWQARFGPGENVQAYRAFKDVWHATPKAWGPKLVIKLDKIAGPRLGLRDKVPVKGFVSWNGATDVEMWHIYAGPNKKTLESLGNARKMGFETVFDINIAQKHCVQVAAVQEGVEVRRSNVACL